MPTYRSDRPKIAITMGDPSGVGGEVLLKALASPEIKRLANFLVITDGWLIERINDKLGLKLLLQEVNGTAPVFNPNAISILELKNVSRKNFKFGTVRAAYGKASLEYIEKAASLLKARLVDGLCTAPICKKSINKAGYKWPGHTEYLAHLAGVERFAMMLVGGPLRVTLVTRHLPFQKVSRSLSRESVYQAVKLTREGLRRFFGIKDPRIGVSALNPHGGEGGLLGLEEKRIIKPAVDRARTLLSKKIKGPFPADALFYDAYRGVYDGIVCMYHDQGLIPLKMIARETGINVTLGLPWPRTSPDHGTAFDIAGKNLADSTSMEEALKLTCRMCDL